MFCLLVLKTSKFSITRARANASKHLSLEGLFVVGQSTPDIYNQILGRLIKGFCYYLESQECTICKEPKTSLETYYIEM
jgi:hypothetical protein